MTFSKLVSTTFCHTGKLPFSRLTSTTFRDYGEHLISSHVGAAPTLHSSWIILTCQISNVRTVRPLDFFHIFLCCSLILKLIKLNVFLINLQHTKYPIMTKRKQVFRNACTFIKKYYLHKYSDPWSPPVINSVDWTLFRKAQLSIYGPTVDSAFRAKNKPWGWRNCPYSSKTWLCRGTDLGKGTKKCLQHWRSPRAHS